MLTREWIKQYSFTEPRRNFMTNETLTRMD